MEKSYNQRWKESGTTLTYKEWRKREDDKMASFDGLIPKLQDTASYQRTKSEMNKDGVVKKDISNKTILGINKYVIVLGGIIILGAVAYRIYQKNK
jgi:hypothetical protein